MHKDKKPSRADVSRRKSPERNQHAKQEQKEKRTKEALTVFCWLNDDSLSRDVLAEPLLLPPRHIREQTDWSVDELKIAWARYVYGGFDRVQLHDAAVDRDDLVQLYAAPEEVDVAELGVQSVAGQVAEVLDGLGWRGDVRELVVLQNMMAGEDAHAGPCSASA
jgi:hypothetical protein